MKLIIASLLIAICLPTWAAKINVTDIFDYAKMQVLVEKEAGLMGLDWKVGDNMDHSIDMGFIKGKMHSFVREEVTEGFWVQQDMDLMIQKQKVEILFEKATGQVLQFLVNGQKQEMPDPADQEIVDMKEDNISVPAGTFDCVYVKVRNKKDNSESEVWLNPSIIPISGMIKQLSASAFGPVKVELTAFTKL